MTRSTICPMANRRFEMIDVERIKVVNSRTRDEDQFRMNVDSIEHTGLLMPIRVNDRFLAETGFYELICGEGRLIAHQRLKKTQISAEVVSCTRREAYLQSLIENIARTKPGTMDFARELKRLKDEGWDCAQIGRVCCKNEDYVRNFIRLVEKGEERLIQGVERGVIPMSFAIQVAFTDDAQVQNVLLDSFDQGLVKSHNFGQIRQIINARLARRTSGNGHPPAPPLTVNALRKDISKRTRTKNTFVRQAKSKENRFLALFVGINTLWRDTELRALLEEEKLIDRPVLEGAYQYEQ